jgi:hypothetical protein
MALEKFIPQSPDRFIRNSKDFEVARFGHLNEMIDYINSYVLPDSLQLAGSGPMTTTLRAITDSSGNASKLFLSTSTTAVSADFRFLGVSSGYVAIKAPNIVTTYTLTLPTTTGSANQGIITDGSGNLSFANILVINSGIINAQGAILQNFSSALGSGGALTITSANAATYNGTVYNVTGAVTISVDNTVPDGFSLTIIQQDANQCTISAGSGLTLRNRLGNTKSAGQWAVITIIRTGSNLILTGDTGV